jgi:enoyl-CoA hydratase/carnithine racemase
MSLEHVIFEQIDAALVIRFNRPNQRNAISAAMMKSIMEKLSEIDTDPSIRGVIITGGDDYFSAGADLREAPGLMSSPVTAVEYMTLWRRFHRSLEELSKPVIAAVEGFCLTGGFELTLACDIRIAGEGSSFGITSSKIGTVPGSGGTQRLPRIVGQSNALDMLFSGDPIDANHAHRIGLINRLVPKGSALSSAKKMVAHYATRAPLSHKLMKRAVYGGVQMDQQSAIEYESFIVTSIYQTEDRLEGINAFLEKRSAKFKGK